MFPQQVPYEERRPVSRANGLFVYLRISVGFPKKKLSHEMRGEHTVTVHQAPVRTEGLYTECHGRNGPNFERVFLMLNYTDITQNTYIQS